MSGTLRLLLACLLPMAVLPSHASPADSERAAAEREWRELKFGLFIHFGLYSIPGGVWNGEKITRGYSEQIQAHGKIPRRDYTRLTEQFNPEKWDPDAIALLAREAGMKYIVLTAKHHDGFCLFNTEHSGYDVVDATPYRLDIVKGLADACERHGLKFGVYFSTIDWNFPHAPPISDHNSDPVPPELENYILAQVEELMTNYGPIREIWFDMGKPTAEQSRRFADTVHRLQPRTRVNGRVWNNAGDFLVMGDNQIPDQYYAMPWQTPASIYHATWGYRSWQVREDLPGKIREMIRGLIRVTARGGNYLLNIGPRGDGSVVEFEADVLKGVGAWLKINGDAVFTAQPVPEAGHPAWGEITASGNRLYLLVLARPEGGDIVLDRLQNEVLSAHALAAPGTPLAFSRGDGALRLKLPETLPDSSASVFVLELKEPARFAPARVLRPDASGVLKISPDQLTPLHGVSGADYYSQRKTIVSLEGCIETPGGKFLLVVEGISATPKRAYRLGIGDQSFSSALPMTPGPVTLPPGPLTLRFERADPAYPAEDLSLSDLRILITPAPESP